MIIPSGKVFDKSETESYFSYFLHLTQGCAIIPSDLNTVMSASSDEVINPIYLTGNYDKFVTKCLERYWNTFTTNLFCKRHVVL